MASTFAIGARLSASAPPNARAESPTTPPGLVAVKAVEVVTDDHQPTEREGWQLV